MPLRGIVLGRIRSEGIGLRRIGHEGIGRRVGRRGIGRRIGRRIGLRGSSLGRLSAHELIEPWLGRLAEEGRLPKDMFPKALGVNLALELELPVVPVVWAVQVNVVVHGG